jgi:hypothetical protein
MMLHHSKDYAGENNGGMAPVPPTGAVLVATFDGAGGAKSLVYTNGCVDISLAGSFGKGATNLSIGLRASDMEHAVGRYFGGLIGTSVSPLTFHLSSDGQWWWSFLFCSIRRHLLVSVC